MNKLIKMLKQLSWCFISTLVLFSYACNSASNLGVIEVNFEGLPDNVEGLAVITSEDDLSSLDAVPIKNGKITFNKAKWGENYKIKLDVPGYYTESSIKASTGQRVTARVKSLNVDENTFYYHWHEDQSVSGLEYSSAVNEPQQIDFLGEKVGVIDNSAAQKLANEYGITLSSEELSWSSEHAYRLYDTLEKMDVNFEKSASMWILTDDAIHNDIEFSEDARKVRITNLAFSYANPFVVKANGKKGRFFSKRLHHAVVRYITDEGEDRFVVDRILESRFGVSVSIPDSKYPEITTPTGGEHHSRFQNFNARELLIIINQFEEMPEGMHRIKELKYLLRRKNGQRHPIYITAAAVAWPTSGYIEFMESAFVPGNLEHTQRLVIHEKSHFLWEHNFGKAIKDEWIRLGGWYLVQEKNEKVWYTTKTTEFVSAYAHSRNPNEDMAESISYFVINPDGLRSRSPAKYAFIRDYIMGNNFYVSKIRDDLTFTVHNLFPDYVYPGKIETVEITAEGAPEEDKDVTVILRLSKSTGSDFEKASSAYTRVTSSIDTFIDIYFEPINENGEEIESSYILKAKFTLPKYAKNGYWIAPQIKITDATGNERYERTNNYGWKLYINNPLEDVLPAEYVENSLVLNLSSEFPCSDPRNPDSGFGGCPEGSTTEEIRILQVQWNVNENIAIKEQNPCFATIVREVSGRRIDPRQYSQSTYGDYEKGMSSGQGAPGTGRCVINLPVNNFFPHGNYSVSRINIDDKALNIKDFDFNTDEEHETSPFISIDFPTKPDETPPKILDNIGDIDISARPTNPDQPNGETVVTLKYTIYDPKSKGGHKGSGYDIAHFYLRDPQGKTHLYYDLSHVNDGTFFFQGDSEEQKRYTLKFTLPVGSAPGLWGVTKIIVFDKAGNVYEGDYTEIVRFSVSE